MSKWSSPCLPQLVICSCQAAGVGAGSLAVEVCCGALQHPQGVRAPAAQHDRAASSATSRQDAVLPLGPVPHMIRCSPSQLIVQPGNGQVKVTGHRSSRQGGAR